MEQVARDGDTFAHKYEPDAADGVNYQGEMGVPRPEGQPPLGIGEVDGPYHLALRRCWMTIRSAILTLRLMGLPYDNWQLYANLFHSVMDASGGDDTTR